MVRAGGQELPFQIANHRRFVIRHSIRVLQTHYFLGCAPCVDHPNTHSQRHWQHFQKSTTHHEKSPAVVHHKNSLIYTELINNTKKEPCTNRQASKGAQRKNACTHTHAHTHKHTNILTVVIGVIIPIFTRRKICNLKQNCDRTTRRQRCTYTHTRTCTNTHTHTHTHT